MATQVDTSENLLYKWIHLLPTLLPQLPEYWSTSLK